MLALQPGRLGSLTLRNRIIRAPTAEAMAGPDGEVTCRLEELYRNLARNGVALIMTGHLWVHPRGRAILNQVGIHDDAMLRGLSRLTQTVHAEGGRVFAEFGHAGSQSRVVDNIPLGPSAVPNPQIGRIPVEMSENDIEETIEAFSQAALRAVRAGFDGIHVAGANGYLISQFNSPYTNRRTDRWGGDAQRRGRFMIEVFRAIRSAVGSDYPFVARIGFVDLVDRGLTLEEGLARIEHLRSLRILDAVEPAQNMIPISTQNVQPYIGVTARQALADLLLHRVWTWGPRPTEAYFLPLAREIRKRTDIPIILMGGIRSTEVMEQILTSGDADFVAMSRPFIREPDLVRQFERGRRGMVDCVSCNACQKLQTRYFVRCWRTPKWRLAYYFSIAGRQMLDRTRLRVVSALKRATASRNQGVIRRERPDDE